MKFREWGFSIWQSAVGSKLKYLDPPPRLGIGLQQCLEGKRSMQMQLLLF